jgi:hypothetical protein
MKKLLALALATVLALSLLTACTVNVDQEKSGGGSTPSGNNSTSTPAGNENPSSTPSGGDSGNQGGDNNDNSAADLEGWLVYDKYAIEAPEGWDIGTNSGSPEAKNSDAFIQLSTMGMSAKDYFEAMRAKVNDDVTAGSYTFKTARSMAGTTLYIYEQGAISVLITTYQVDSEIEKAVLESFKVN